MTCGLHFRIPSFPSLKGIFWVSRGWTQGSWKSMQFKCPLAHCDYCIINPLFFKEHFGQLCVNKFYLWLDTRFLNVWMETGNHIGCWSPILRLGRLKIIKCCTNIHNFQFKKICRCMSLYEVIDLDFVKFCCSCLIQLMMPCFLKPINLIDISYFQD